MTWQRLLCAPYVASFVLQRSFLALMSHEASPDHRRPAVVLRRRPASLLPAHDDHCFGYHRAPPRNRQAFRSASSSLTRSKSLAMFPPVRSCPQLRTPLKRIIALSWYVREDAPAL